MNSTKVISRSADILNKHQQQHLYVDSIINTGGIICILFT